MDDNISAATAPTHLNIDLATDIVAAYVSNNHVRSGELPELIATIHAAIAGLGTGGTSTSPTVEKMTSAQIKRSITPDGLVSFLDGKPYKTLKRHLSTHGLTFEAYRERYGLPRDYPSTAASYSARRSELARSLGLGQLRKTAPKAAETSGAEAAAEPKAGGRKKAAGTRAKPAKARKAKKAPEDASAE